MSNVMYRVWHAHLWQCPIRSSFHTFQSDFGRFASERGIPVVRNADAYTCASQEVSRTSSGPDLARNRYKSVLLLSFVLSFDHTNENVDHRLFAVVKEE